MELLSKEMAERLALLFLRTRYVTGKVGATDQEIEAVLAWANEVIVSYAFLNAVLAQTIMLDLTDNEVSFSPFILSEFDTPDEFDTKFVNQVEQYINDMFKNENKDSDE